MKQNPSNPNEDLQAIREIMERSSRFLSLSGLSGIYAGVCALSGAVLAWLLILDRGEIQFGRIISDPAISLTSGIGLQFALASLLVLVAAVPGALYFSYRKARMAGEMTWSRTTNRLIMQILIPLVSGAAFILILAFRNSLELAASAMLIFYGLSLVNAAKFTFSEIHHLGLIEIGLGILAGIFISCGLLFWTLGFGLMHIIYGAMMYYRHEHRQQGRYHQSTH